MYAVRFAENIRIVYHTIVHIKEEMLHFLKMRVRLLPDLERELFENSRSGAEGESTETI